MSESEEAVTALAEAMRCNKRVVALSLAHNYIQAAGAAALCECSIKKKRVLTSLDLSRNRFGAKGGKALAETLRFNGALRHLALADNGIPPEFAARIRKVCAEKGITLDRFDAAPEDEDGDEDADDE